MSRFLFVMGGFAMDCYRLGHIGIVRRGEERCGHHRLTKRFPTSSCVFSETGITVSGPIACFRISEWDVASPASVFVF